MSHKERFKFFILMFCTLFFLMMTIVAGGFIIDYGFATEEVVVLLVCGGLLLVSIYFLVGFVKKSEHKEYIYLCFRLVVLMIIAIIVFIVVALFIQNSVATFVVLITMSILISLYTTKEVRQKGVYKESTKICCSYKNIKVFGKNQTENVEVGDVLMDPYVLNKQLWELKNKNGKLVGCVYRPDIMHDLKSRKIQGLNIFTVSKIDSKGNIYVDIDVYISKYKVLNLWASYDNSLEKTYFMIDGNKEPKKSLTIVRPILENKNNINSKFVLKSKEMFLGEVFENVKVVDYNNYSSDIFNNEKLEVCYDENGDVLLLSNFDSLPVGHIGDEKIKGLINSYNDSQGIIIVSVQKIENDDEANKKDVYVKVVLYDNTDSTTWVDL